MLNQEYSLKIAHLYPNLLNIYGDFGNIIALKKRLEDRNITCEVINFSVCDNPYEKINECNVFFIGGGQDIQQNEVAKSLKQHKDFFTQKANEGNVFLGICGGYQLMGEYYKPHDMDKQEGLGILDVYTVASSKRFIGNVSVKLKKEIFDGTLVGFENHSGLTYITSEETKAIGDVIVGNGNNGDDKQEGACKNNVFGTYLHGSFLPKNPKFADYLIFQALKTKYQKEIVLPPLDDKIETLTHESLLRLS